MFLVAGNRSLPPPPASDESIGMIRHSARLVVHSTPMRTLVRAILFVLAISLAPALAYAALININTADVTLLDTLSGIGPTKAAAIVDYRDANGPFDRVEDIQNVSGIGPSTFADIAPFITVGDASASSTSATVESTTTATTAAPSGGSGGSASTYVSPPSLQSYSLDIGKDRKALLNVPVYLKATVKGRGGASAAPTVTWSFGDGGVGEGKKVRHVYHFPASYVVMVEASSGAWSNTARGDISISPTQLMIAKVVAGPEGVVEISNGGSIDVDLSSWLLQSNGTFFVFPAHTFLSAKRSVPFPSAVTNFLADPNDTVLLYPNGRPAVRFSPSDSVVPTPVLALTVTPAVTSSEQTVLEPEPPKAVAKESEVIQKKETFPEKKTETVASSTPAGTLAAAALMSVDSQTKPPRTSLWFGSALALAILGAGGFLFMHGTNPSGFVPEAIEEEKGGRALSADDFDIIED